MAPLVAKDTKPSQISPALWDDLWENYSTLMEGLYAIHIKIPEKYTGERTYYMLSLMDEFDLPEIANMALIYWIDDLAGANVIPWFPARQIVVCKQC
jgi:hypothetical protein